MIRSRDNLIPEIQGLRAVAVVAVLFYHLWPELLPGGYVGVDVFFVISGYLITQSLFKEFHQTGTIRVSEFYARRIRRLMPAASLVCVAVALCAPMFPRTEWASITGDIFASTAYVQNWWLASQAVDYLAGDRKGPLNHFWSLSVEEQYYFLWPLITLAVLHVSTVITRNHQRAYLYVIAAIILISLAYSSILTSLNPGLAYFATTTRAWELALGGALAVVHGRRKVPERLHALFGFIGLAGVVGACLSLSDSTPFPGYAALWPTLAAVAVIASSGGHELFLPQKILRLSFLQYLGEISYSLYLWHWPIIVAYRQWSSVGPIEGAIILLLAGTLAHFSKIYVEDYFRTSPYPARRTLAAGAVCMLLILSGTSVTHIALESGSLQADSTKAVGALALVNPGYKWRDQDVSTVVPKPEFASRDVSSAHQLKCHQNWYGTEVLTCDHGSPNGTLKIVMVGDSHAAHWYPTFEEITKTRPIYFRSISKSACLFSSSMVVYNSGLKRPYTECTEWSQKVIEWLAQERPDIVLISQSPAYPDAAVGAMAATWARLIEMGLDVRPIRSTPWMPTEPAACLSKARNWIADCVPSRANSFKPDLTLLAAEILKVQTLDFSEYFCDGDQCPIVIGGVLVYRDRHHMTATYARTLSTVMEKRLSLDSAL